MRTVRSFGAAIALGGMALLTAQRAGATPDFPSALASDLALSHAPDCIVCHQSDAGGKGTVTKPFGMYMRSRGLVEFDETSLANAALALKGEAAAGVAVPKAFLAALYAGADPNAGLDGSTDGPVYGCQAGVASGPVERAGRSVLVAVALGIAAVARRRRRGGVARVRS